MVPLTELWLPILLSGLFVFLVSSVIHMGTSLHKNDLRKVPDEDDVMAALRKAGLQPGEYMLPRVDSMKDCSSPEFIEKCKQGPVLTMTVVPNGVMNIGKSLMQWFLWTLVVGLFVAYLTGRALGPGAEYLTVFRIAGTVAVLGYAFCNVTNSIWKGSPWSTTAKFMFDGLLYGLTTAGTFAWLWPNVGA